MKCTVTIDKSREEEVLIFAHEKNKLVCEIENLVEANQVEIVGYFEKEIIILLPNEICCFIVENNKIYALTQDKKILLKQRLYELEEILDSGFIKVNQSCIANIKQIKRFDASISGSLVVIFKNGHRDYVSRRQLKHVKERMGI